MIDHFLPENISTYGASIDTMFRVIYYLTGFVFLAVAAVMVYYLIKYRDKNDGRRATYSHGNNRLEIIWTVIPAVIFICLGVWSEVTWALVKKSQPTPDLVVKLTANQFNWAFQYPGPDGTFQTGWKGKDGKAGTGDDRAQSDDYLSNNLLRVPVNKVVQVQMEAEDVIHSFFLPHLRVKQDTVPGRQINMWFEATATTQAFKDKRGDSKAFYEIACAELCGIGHTTMSGELRVLSNEEWNEWVTAAETVGEDGKVKRQGPGQWTGKTWAGIGGRM